MSSGLRPRAAVAALLLLAAAWRPPASLARAELLDPGVPQRGTLRGGQVRSYEIALGADEWLALAFNDDGMYLLARGPDGAVIADTGEAVNTHGGPGRLFLRSRAAGVHRIELGGRRNMAGRTAENWRVEYELAVRERRAARPEDERWIAAQAALARAARLSVQERRQWNEGTLSTAGLVTAHQVALEAFRLWDEIGDPRGRFEARYMACDFSNQGSAAVRDCYEAALELARAASDPWAEAAALNGLGDALRELGRADEAVDAYTEALRIRRELGNAAPIFPHNLGIALREVGEYQRAFEHSGAALAAFAALGEPQALAFGLWRNGLLRQDVGDLEGALDLYARALPAWRAAAQVWGESETLGDMAVALARLGRSEEAVGHARRALDMKLGMRDEAGAARARSALGWVLLDAARPDEARALFEAALPVLRKYDYRSREADALRGLADAARRSGRVEDAIRTLNQALATDVALRDRDGEAASLQLLARAEADRERLETAQRHVERALALVEQTRSAVLAPDLRSGYGASRAALHELHVDLLMRRHAREPSGRFAAQALQANEKRRAIGLLETLVATRAAIREGVSAELLQKERRLAYRIGAAAARLTRAWSGAAPTAERDASEARLRELLAERDRLEGQIRLVSPRYAALTRPQPMSSSEIQRELDPGTLLLEFALGDERSYLWAVGRDSLRAFVLPPRRTVDAAARRVHDALVEGRRHEANVAFRAAAVALSRMLLEPLGPRLAARRLVVVADGALHFVPFAALPLPGGQDPLVLEHELVKLPSLSALRVLRRQSERAPRPGTVALLADAVLQPDDPRLSGGGPPAAADAHRDLLRSASDSGRVALERLPYTRDEAAAIAALVPAEAQLQALDFDASRETALSPELARYRIVHFATHALLNNRQPELSGLVLSLFDRRGQSRDGFLRLHDVYNLRLRADLVVLSACRTALGAEVRGEGLVGLTRGFMYAGAPRVVASLWDVQDRATAELMKLFYGHMLREGQPPAAALRSAQLALLRDPRFAAPYAWAGFELIGEWR